MMYEHKRILQNKAAIKNSKITILLNKLKRIFFWSSISLLTLSQNKAKFKKIRNYV